MSVLVAKEVTKRFGGLQALSRIDLDVKENSIHSIIGPNGAGKTTFFNCVTGFYTRLRKVQFSWLEKISRVSRQTA
jgi:branched-chain amino acid transport system ATP-binding protein